MNNKIIGTAFERELCDRLAAAGYWVHFITPDARGAQPFDIIAVKNGDALAIDCKTCALDRINFKRLEENQVMAFERWVACGNMPPLVAVLHKGIIYCVTYAYLKAAGSVKLTPELIWFKEAE